MSIVSFVKKWTLPVSICVGTVFYLLFSNVELLEPVGYTVGPVLVDTLPYGMFLILYVTFCKIQLRDMKPRPWHLWLQIARVAISVALVWLITSVDDEGLKLVLEGAFVCVVCPTAAAAAVVTEKLGGSIASLTIFTIIDNLVIAHHPRSFPFCRERGAHTFRGHVAACIAQCGLGACGTVGACRAHP